MLFAPLFLNPDHNQAMMDMARILNAFNSALNDYFVRIDLERVPMADIHDVPGIARQTFVNMTLVGTNQNFRSIRSWDINVTTRAEQLLERFISDPVLRQNMNNQILVAELTNEEMVQYLDVLVANFERQLTTMIQGYMNSQQNQGGMLATTEMTVQEFDAAMQLVARNAANNMTVNAFNLHVGQWVPQPLIEFYNGVGIATRLPGTYAFTGRVVDISGIVEEPRGNEMLTIVARFGLEDLFGMNVDLQQNANRHMVVGSIARMAGAPLGVDPMAWADANLNVVMTTRNPNALISRQEAIAMVMALYEVSTNTQVSSIMIRNYQNTAGMELDSRYAHAVRAAFEIGIINDTEMNPAGPINIGEFLDMLAALGARVTF